MFNELYWKRTIKKHTVHGNDTVFELYATQQAREFNWDEFKGSNHLWFSFAMMLYTVSNFVLMKIYKQSINEERIQITNFLILRWKSSRWDNNVEYMSVNHRSSDQILWRYHKKMYLAPGSLSRGCTCAIWFWFWIFKIKLKIILFVVEKNHTKNCLLASLRMCPQDQKASVQRISVVAHWQ